MTKRALGLACAFSCLLAVSMLDARAQESATSAATLRIEARIRALQQEADRLAASARTLVGEMRALEIARDLKQTESLQAEAAVDEAAGALSTTGERLSALEQQQLAQMPALRSQLVDLYKRGDAGYLGVLFRGGSLRDLGRSARALAALAARNRRRLEAHRKTLAAVTRERTTLEERTRAVEERRIAAQQARAAADKALAAHAARMAKVDARRDLTAQYVGELQVAREALLERLASRDGESHTSEFGVPLAPFRGALAWPVEGVLLGRFGQPANRLGGSAVRNGIEMSAALGAPVRAIHGGTVAHADPYLGFGTLVILDHGGNHYSLYGYLGATSVTAGQVVEAGTELGQVGASPAGPSALYFEMRIDGRSVDPVQWFEPR